MLTLLPGGSPILQNGKLAGAVTHVMVNEPGKGYGILIENMLEQAGRMIREYIAYYNFNRLQRRLGVHTPMEIFTQYRAA